MHISDLKAPILADMAAVDDVIRACLTSEVPLINQISEYIIAAGGKRLRPVLLVLVAGALGYRGPKAHELAAVVELIHTATLLHDDVVDESDLRRGRKTANALFGNAASVLVGDFLYSRSFQMMVKAGNMQVMEVLSEATNVIAEGEVLQLMNIGDVEVSEARYLRVIRYKTAKLFEAASRLGAIVAGADASATERMAEFGMRLGTAFQLIDDVLDYSGSADETGKNVGDDLVEGKPTLPLIHVLSSGTPVQRDAARKAIAEPGAVDFRTVLDAINSTGALDYTRRVADAEVGRAMRALGGLTPSIHLETLIQLCAVAVERKG
jgi:octaprenyl-diphosphate synthase